MKKAAPFFKGILTICAAARACILLLLAVIAAIPQSAIAENSRASAGYFSAHDGFPLLVDGVEGSRMDNYADTALLDVIYCADSENPFTSMIVDPYYRNDGQDIRADFQAAVDGAAPNNEYARYWHGSQVLLRPLLMLTDIQGCRVVLFALLLVLNGILAWLLVRKKAWIPLVAYFASLLLVQFWTAAFTLEYIMVLLVMSAACIAVTAWQGRGEGRITTVFILSGVLTCFLDFLTAETLTFTIPVILLLMLWEQESASLKTQMLRLIKWGCAWLFSYAAMFAIKLLLVLMVAGKETFAGIFQFAALRIEGQTLLADGSVGEVSPFTALARNLACLWPFSDENASVMGVLLTAVVVLLVLLAALYLFRGEKARFSYMAVLFAVGLVPYLRYVLIYSHAHVHYFFTFRAQMALLMALIAMFVHGFHDSPLWRRKPAKKKGGRR